MKTALLVSGVFLLLMALTRGDFWVSALGAGWVYCSGFTQWWYSSPAMLPEMVGSLAISLAAVHTLALSESRAGMAAAAGIAAAAFLNFAFCAYPPFQIVLVYLAAAVLVGRLSAAEAIAALRRHWRFRLAAAALAVGSTTAALAVYLRDIGPTLDLVRGTVYPGARHAAGGELSLAEVFGGFYGYFMSQDRFPQGWLNACEASNFLLLFPIPLAAVLWDLFRRRRVNPLQVCLLIYILAVITWLVGGWPEIVASVTGFSRIPGRRALLGLGLASILSCVVYLADPHGGNTGNAKRTWILAAGFVAFLLLHGLGFRRATGNFVTSGAILLVAVIGGAAGLFLLTRRKAAFAACVLIPGCLGFGLVNPVARGLAPVTSRPLFQEVSKIVRSDPHARWAVYGNHVVANYLKAAGAPVFNGTHVVPPLADLRLLDPRDSARLFYNRYGHITLVSRPDPGIAFLLAAFDAYGIRVDPGHEVWRRLGIKYVTLPEKALTETLLRTARPVLDHPVDKFWIYEFTTGQK
jgi:hypothetical protein